MILKIEEILQNFSSWPSRRSGHRMCADGNYLYLFGGFDADEGNKLYSELWRFNISTQRWTRLPDKENHCPKECASSSMVIWKHFVIVFGGSGYPFSWTNSNHLYMYCLRNLKWSTIDGLNLNEIVIRKKLCDCYKIKHNKPKSKYGHSMELYNNKLIIFSGTTGRHFTKELHQFNLNKFEWSKIKLCQIHKGCVPIGRYRHESFIWDKKYYNFGGAVLTNYFGFENIPVLDMTTKTWEVIQTTSTKVLSQSQGNDIMCFPDARKAHACVLFNDCAYLIGGINDDHVFQDIWILDLKLKEWACQTTVQFPQKIYFHATAVSVHGCLFVHGGVTEKQKRSSRLYKVWLAIPPLAELAWMNIVKTLNSKKCLSKTKLEELHIPRKFSNRVETP